jgi:hypothetical protein
MDIHEQEAMQQRLVELGEELTVKQQRIEALEKNSKGYIDELARVAKGTAELYQILQESQNAGDRLRNRLRKVLDAFESAMKLLQAVEAGSIECVELRKAYNKALLNLDTPDNIPGTMQAAPEKP